MENPRKKPSEPNMIDTLFLLLHIGAGAVALATAGVAAFAAKGRRNHVRAGRIYTVSMAIVFLTAVPLALLGDDVFLLLVAFFSFYLVFAGWRLARNRQGRPHPVDWLATGIVGATGLLMGGYAVVLAKSGDSQWVTMTLFAGIALGLGITDGLDHRLRRARGARRIARHLTRMLAGTIATVTALLVVNVNTNPPWIAWILPTVLIVPFIVWWNRRVRGPHA